MHQVLQCSACFAALSQLALDRDDVVTMSAAQHNVSQAQECLLCLPGLSDFRTIDPLPDPLADQMSIAVERHTGCQLWCAS